MMATDHNEVCAADAELWRRALGDLVPDAEQRMLLARHWELVSLWNARTNLTAIRDAEVAAIKHYRDSLMALPYLSGGPVVDFGSGAGFPGMVLAIVRPTWHVTLVEPRRKRASFLEVAKARLGLTHVRVHHGRLEDAADKAYAHAVSRATFAEEGFMPKAEVFAHAVRWLDRDGSLLLYRSAAGCPGAEKDTSRASGGRVADGDNMQCTGSEGSAGERFAPAMQHRYTLASCDGSVDTARTIDVWPARRLVPHLQNNCPDAAAGGMNG